MAADGVSESFGEGGLIYRPKDLRRRLWRPPSEVSFIKRVEGPMSP